MSDLRSYRLDLAGTVTMVTDTCCNCGVLFAMTEDYQRKRRNERDSFYCPNGHGQHYTGPTDTDRLKQAVARETALQDQLGAAVREAEQTRATLLRDRQRFANGACPCCNRYFDNVRRHMATKHPDYDVTRIEATALRFRCSCGFESDSLHGLRTHQGRSRRTGWEAEKSKRAQHLTAV